MTSCPRCNTPLPSQALAGLCPKCIAVRSLSDGNGNGCTPTVLAPEKIGRRFGDYELLHEIARGGMGVVFKARQISLNRTVAVKMILNGHLASEEQVQRFRLEAESAGSLQHPNIVPVHEVGVFEGHHYFSMDYVEGRNLSQLVRDGPLAPGRAARYIRSIAEAIQFAHQQGVLHRDLKPSNILIDRFDQPRITDFGLAKRVQGDSDLTVTGQALGTPSFMPPEQISGKSAECGAHGDVYSLGAILYFLLTARPPFLGRTREETLLQVRNSEPTSPRKLDATVPAELETICLKCLEKEGRRRYASAEELGQELRRFLQAEPIQARPVGAAAKIWRRCRRHPAITTAAVTALLCLSALVIAFRLIPRPSAPQHPAPVPVLSGSGVGGLINGKIYQTSPCDGYPGARNHFHAYDPRANRWSHALPACPVVHGDCAGAVLGGKFYLAGGNFGESGKTRILNRVDVYDPKANDWQTVAPMPTARTFAAAAALNRKLWVIGGIAGTNFLSAVEIYDPATGHWASGPALPSPRASARAVDVNGRFFVLGGACSDRNQLLSDSLLELESAGGWAERRPLPVAVSTPAVAVHDGTIYVIGGDCATRIVATVQAYNVAAQEWKILAPMPEPRFNGVTANVVDGKIFVIGGWSIEPALPHDDVFVYDPRRDTWWR